MCARDVLTSVSTNVTIIGAKFVMSKKTVWPWSRVIFGISVQHFRKRIGYKGERLKTCC